MRSAAEPSSPVRVAAADAPKSLLWREVHLAVLCSLAFAWPLFDLLRDNAEFFAIRGSRPIDIVVFALALVLGPPLVLVVIEALVGAANRPWVSPLHVGLVGALAAIIALGVIKRMSGSSALDIPIALLLGLGAAIIYARVSAARWALSVLAPLPLALLVAFLFFSPVTELVTGHEAHARLGTGASRTPVVMVVLDELPLTSLLEADGKIDAQRFPNFAALARESDWFSNTAATDAFTQVAVPAILTGARPVKGELPTFADHPNSVFTLLGANHRLHVDESITRLCPRSLCRRPGSDFGSRIGSLASDLSVVSLHLLLPDDLRRRLPAIDSSWQHFRGGPSRAEPEVTSRQLEKEIERKRPDQNRGAIAESFLAGVGRSPADARPPFDFIHLVMPHVPWQYLPDGSTYGAASAVVGLENEKWASAGGATDAGYQRHLLQLAYADRLLGRLLHRLRASGAYDRSLIVVTADHGASFRPGEFRRKLTRANAQDILPVPLFIKRPEQHRGRIIRTHLQTLDILPTMAALLGQRIPWHVDGRSAYAAGADRRTVTTTNGGRGALTFDTRRVERLRRAAIRTKLALFGTGGARAPFGGFALDPELVGRPVGSMTRVSPRGARATIDDAAAYQDVSLSAGLLPVHVTGRVSEGDVARVAIAVNGTVAAVARVVGVGDADAYEAILPPSTLHGGTNRIEILALGRAGGRTTFATLGGAGGARPPSPSATATSADRRAGGTASGPAGSPAPSTTRTPTRVASR